MNTSNEELRKKGEADGKPLPVYQITGVRKLGTNHFQLYTDTKVFILTGYNPPTKGFEEEYYVEVWDQTELGMDPLRMYTDRDNPHARVVFWSALELMQRSMEA